MQRILYFIDNQNCNVKNVDRYLFLWQILASNVQVLLFALSVPLCSNFPVTRNDWLSLDDVYSHTLCPGETCVYRKTGNFRVVQFSRNFAVSINPRKLKSAKYFPIFEKIVLRN